MFVVAAAQYAPPHRDPHGARERALEAVRAAHEVGASLVVLPELANSGYVFPDRDEALPFCEPASGGPFLESLAAEARERDIAIATGFAERDATTAYNSAALLLPDGRRAVYRKLHVFGREKGVFAPGDAPPPVCRWRGVGIGLAICFDWQFPEHWRLLALAGVDLVAHPSNLVIPGRCQRALPVHAMLNRFAIVTANRIGREGEVVFTGRSLVVDARGEVLAEAEEAVEIVLHAALDPADSRDKRVGENNDLLADRRPEHYGGLAAPWRPEGA